MASDVPDTYTTDSSYMYCSVAQPSMYSVEYSVAVIKRWQKIVYEATFDTTVDATGSSRLRIHMKMSWTM